jgi:hypothetical protein
MAVASLKPVPQDVKNKLKSLGIEVIDHVYPGGAGEKTAYRIHQTGSITKVRDSKCLMQHGQSFGT